MAKARLLTAPAGGGKTSSVIDAILQRKMLHPWQQIWILLPTELQISVFRDRLLDACKSRNNINVVFGVQYFTFYELYNHLLDRIGIPQKQIRSGSVYRILRHLILELNDRGELRYFQPIADKPGLIDLVGRFIYELKQAVVFPSEFAEYAEEHSGKDKDRDIALIYDTYQAWLRHKNAVDREGAGWLALDYLTTDEPVDYFDGVDMLVVDGFLQFSPLQAQLLGALAKQIKHTVVTLTDEAEREQTLHRRANRIRDHLEKSGTWQHNPLRRKANLLHRSPVLQYLERHFLTNVVEPMSAEDAVVLIEAPNPEQEVRGVLQRVKRLLLDGHSPDQIVVLAHNMETYADLIRSIAETYTIPVVLRRGVILAQNPVVVAILKLLDLHTYSVNFRRQHVLDVLRSPYFYFSQFSDNDVAILDRLSVQFQVIQSREDWLDSIQRAAEDKLVVDEDGEPEEDSVLSDTIDYGELYARLEDFFERITPPASSTVQDYVLWLEALLGQDPSYVRGVMADDGHDVAVLEGMDGQHLHLFERTRSVSQLTNFTASDIVQTVMVRDLYAIQTLWSALRGIIAAYTLIIDGQQRGLSSPLGWRQFRADLQLAVDEQRSEPVGGTARQGRVLVTNASEARGLPHDHVFILGLAEGVFPAQQREDPLYSDRERDTFTQITGYDLQTTLERQDDVVVFYECLGMARQTITLSRPTLDEGANAWEPSLLWRAVMSILSDIKTIRFRAGEAPTFENAANIREVGVALSNMLNQPIDSDIEITAIEAVSDWLSQHPHYSQRWNGVLRGRGIEARREDRGVPFGRFSGVLEDERLIPRVAALLGPGRRWSASQFNDYGYCGFRFFSKRLLKLEALEEPTEGFDAAQLGTVQHAVLENTYRRLMEEDVVIHPDNAEIAKQILQDEADKLLPEAPYLFGFRSSALWQHEQSEIRQRLTRLVELDFSNHPDSPFIMRSRGKKGEVATVVNGQERHVYRLEADFGMDDGVTATIGGEAGDLQVRGMIDRIDRVGDSLIVIDYKSGTVTPKTTDMEAGRNFQMMLYLLSAQQIIKRENPDLNVEAGMFWSIRSLKSGGEIRADAGQIEAARQILHGYIQDGREGRFEVEPRKLEDGKCFKYCEFGKFCRVHQTRRFDSD
jgi:ATP-dependent helicase/DNAse subunit B